MSLLVSVNRHLRTQQTIMGRLAFEGSLVVVGATAVGLLAAAISISPLIDRANTHLVLSLLAAGVGAAAVGLGQTAGRMAGNRRANWLIPAFALYSAVIVPGTALLPPRAEDAASVNVGMLAAFMMIVVLLLAGIRPPPRSGSRAGWVLASAGATLALVLNGTVIVLPQTGSALASPLPVSIGVLTVWCSVSTAVVLAGLRTSSPPLWRLGLGFGVIATAHLYRVSRPGSLAQPSLVFAALRLLGVVVVLFGMAQLLRRALQTVLGERFSHQEDLRLATLHVERLTRDVAERDHELRNCLTGLTGMTKMLATLEVDEPRGQACSAVLSELARMSELLDHSGTGSDSGVYDAAHVVRELVALWKVAGLDLEVTTPAELTAVGRASTLAQVLTNVLRNCARHAAGSHVTVVARQNGRLVTVQVSDDGAKPSGTSAVRDDQGGQGIGLKLSGRLVEAEGGRLRVVAAELDRPGFTVVVELRAMPSPRSQPVTGRVVSSGRGPMVPVSGG